MKELNIGVIGVSRRGTLADYAHQPDKGVRIVAGADIVPEYLEEFVKRLKSDRPVRTYGDYRELLAQPDIQAVFITSPDFTHEEYAVAALEAGKAVYLEKPMAITIEGCDRILEAACRTGSKLYLGHNMRHFPVILKMKEIVESGMIGRVRAVWCRHFISYGGDAYFKDWHSEQRLANGLLLQKGAHDIDVIHYLTGGYTTAVTGMGMLSVYDRCARRRPEERGNPDFVESNWPPLSQTGLSPIIDVEDHNMILMQLDNGVQAAYLQCHYTPDAERNYTVIGEAGRIENIGDFGNCEVQVWNTRGSRSNPDIIYKLREIPGSHGGADPAVVDTFIDFVRYGKAPLTSPVAARNAVAVGVLGHRSMRGDGCRLEIPAVAPAVAAYFAGNQKK